MKLQSGSHSVFNLKVHLVFVVAYRRKAISARILSDLHHWFSEACLYSGVELIEFSGESDHVHLLVGMKPSVRLSDLVRTLKSYSSSKIRLNHWVEIRKKLWGTRFWSRSYCAISVGDGATTEIIKRYIPQQDKPR